MGAFEEDIQSKKSGDETMEADKLEYAMIAESLSESDKKLWQDFSQDMEGKSAAEKSSAVELFLNDNDTTPGFYLVMINYQNQAEKDVARPVFAEDLEPPSAADLEKAVALIKGTAYGENLFDYMEMDLDRQQHRDLVDEAILDEANLEIRPQLDIIKKQLDFNQEQDVAILRDLEDGRTFDRVDNINRIDMEIEKIEAGGEVTPTWMRNSFLNTELVNQREMQEKEIIRDNEMSELTARTKNLLSDNIKEEIRNNNEVGKLTAIEVGKFLDSKLDIDDATKHNLLTLKSGLMWEEAEAKFNTVEKEGENETYLKINAERLEATRNIELLQTNRVMTLSDEFDTNRLDGLTNNSDKLVEFERLKADLNANENPVSEETRFIRDVLRLDGVDKINDYVNIQMKIKAATGLGEKTQDFLRSRSEILKPDVQKLVKGDSIAALELLDITTVTYAYDAKGKISNDTIKSIQDKSGGNEILALLEKGGTPADIMSKLDAFKSKSENFDVSVQIDMVRANIMKEIQDLSSVVLADTQSYLPKETTDAASEKGSFVRLKEGGVVALSAHDYTRYNDLKEATKGLDASVQNVKITAYLAENYLNQSMKDAIKEFTPNPEKINSANFTKAFEELITTEIGEKLSELLGSDPATNIQNLDRFLKKNPDLDVKQVAKLDMLRNDQEYAMFENYIDSNKGLTDEMILRLRLSQDNLNESSGKLRDTFDPDTTTGTKTTMLKPNEEQYGVSYNLLSKSLDSSVVDSLFAEGKPNQDKIKAFIKENPGLTPETQVNLATMSNFSRNTEYEEQIFGRDIAPTEEKEVAMQINYRPIVLEKEEMDQTTIYSIKAGQTFGEIYPAVEKLEMATTSTEIASGLVVGADDATRYREAIKDTGVFDILREEKIRKEKPDTGEFYLDPENIRVRDDLDVSVADEDSDELFKSGITSTLLAEGEKGKLNQVIPKIEGGDPAEARRLLEIKEGIVPGDENERPDMEIRTEEGDSLKLTSGDEIKRSEEDPEVLASDWEFTTAEGGGITSNRLPIIQAKETDKAPEGSMSPGRSDNTVKFIDEGFIAGVQPMTGPTGVIFISSDGGSGTASASVATAVGDVGQRLSVSQETPSPPPPPPPPAQAVVFSSVVSGGGGVSRRKYANKIKPDPLDDSDGQDNLVDQFEDALSALSEDSIW